MRRELLEQLPAFCHLFHLRPWEVEMLTMDEIDECLRYLAEYEADLKRQQEEFRG